EGAEPCDRVAVLDQGRLAALGPPAELKRAAGAGSLEEVFLAHTGHRLSETDGARARARCTGSSRASSCGSCGSAAACWRASGGRSSGWCSRGRGSQAYSQGGTRSTTVSTWRPACWEWW